MFPLITSTTIPFHDFAPRTGDIVLKNPNPLPADLTIEWFIRPNLHGVETATVPAGGTWAYHLLALNGLEGTITSSQPLRALRGISITNARSTDYTDLYPPAAPPLIGSIVNAAAQTQGAVAPGEIITIYGIGGKSVLSDGRPAPLLYSSSIDSYSGPGGSDRPIRVTALSVMVPYEVANQPWTNIEVVDAGVKSAAWGTPVVSSAPAIFTLDSSGLGQAAVLNQDNSANGPSNPAGPGSVIQVFATGFGRPGSPVQATIGGLEAVVQFAGQAPDLIAGVWQVNVVIPRELTPGSALPISLSVGGVHSPDAVTIAVQ